MPISRELLDILVCPQCKTPVKLTPDGAGLKCSPAAASIRSKTTYRSCFPRKLLSHLNSADALFSADPVPRSSVCSRASREAHRRPRRPDARPLSLGHGHSLSPEAAVPVVDFVEQSECLGGAGNVAANLAALGARVEAFGAVGGEKGGDDEPGRALRACLRAAAIGDHGVIADPKRITRSNAHHRATSTGCRVDRERREPLRAETRKSSFAGSLPRSAAWTPWSSRITTRTYHRRLRRPRLNACHRLGVPVFVKPKTSRLTPIAAPAPLSATTGSELLCHACVGDDKSIEEAGRALLAHFGCAPSSSRAAKGHERLRGGLTKHFHVPQQALTSPTPVLASLVSSAARRAARYLTGPARAIPCSQRWLLRRRGRVASGRCRSRKRCRGVVVGKLGTATVTRKN